MISTSSYKSMKNKNIKTISISMDEGADADYKGGCYLSLAPKKDFFRTWKDNRGIIPEDVNNKYYIEHYYDEVLSLLNPEEVYAYLDNTTLLCYESNMEFCHRHIVAAWLELLLDITVPEVKLIKNQLVIVNRPEYIKEYLEQYMKSKIDMKGFKSLRARFVYEKSEYYQRKAEVTKVINDDYYEGFIHLSNLLKSEAFELDEIYNDRVKTLKK